MIKTTDNGFNMELKQNLESQIEEKDRLLLEQE
jgi:hypothetical protein